MMLEFNEDKHIYYLDGEQIPCVSEILRFAFREVYGTDKKDKAMDRAALRGTRIHRACEEIDRTGMTECEPDILQYVSAYVQFLKDHDVSWEEIEKPIFSSSGHVAFAGTLDRLGVVDGKMTLLDIKSTKSITAKHKLLYSTQLAAYGACMDRFIDQFCILQLKADGTYKLIKVEPNANVWCSCLMMHYEFMKTERRKKVSK